MSSLIYLVRHGETEWNRQQRIQGSTDIPLNETGRAQARATGQLLAEFEPSVIFTSPLSRASETASIMSRLLALPTPIGVPGLVERNYGAAEGLDYLEVEDRFPDRSLVPGQESKRDLVTRSLLAVLGIARKHDGAPIVVVAHGGVIRAILGEIDPDGSHGRINNGSAHSVRYSDDRLSLITFDLSAAAATNIPA